MQTTTSAVDTGLVSQTARAIFDNFKAYRAEFKGITARAKQRFEQRDWHGLHDDAVARLDLYKDYVARLVSGLNESLRRHAQDPAFWTALKQRYTELIKWRNDFELAQSFYNSVIMRIVGQGGIDAQIEFMGTEIKPPQPSEEEPAYRVYALTSGSPELVREILLDCGFSTNFRNLEIDAEQAANLIDCSLQQRRHGEIQTVEIAEPIFYRGKSAYLVGRVCADNSYMPLVISLGNSDEGIYIDAVLPTEDEVSIIFSFARSYFHVEVEKPHALVGFLKAIMPLKPVAELYISLGYNKHGKTELYRDLIRHLHRSTDKFEIARGDKGMVMTVFTLPSYDVVFKIIKDTFDYPKNTTRQEVRNRYHLVFKHDRGGRLVDAQEFEYLRIEKSRFAPELLEELLAVASNTVKVRGDEVEIRHLYTERRLTPLNLYIREANEEAASEAVIDYGQAIKDLAATNIFPGDILLKNFGVTRHGRVVFYDYDELCLLTECNFRAMPQTADPFDEMNEENWFSVGEQDVFPEELKTFLGLPQPLAQVFTEHHGDLFTVEFWSDIVERLKAGEVIDILPYKERRRIRHADN